MALSQIAAHGHVMTGVAALPAMVESATRWVIVSPSHDRVGAVFTTTATHYSVTITNPRWGTDIRTIKCSIGLPIAKPAV